MSPIHATAILLDGAGVLLLGAAGSGKSALAVKMMEDYHARLVADDRVHLTLKDDTLCAAPPETLRGLLELRGLGVVAVPYVDAAPLHLAVELVARAAVPRLAPADYFEALSCRVPKLALHAFDAATPFTLRQAIEHLPKNGFSETGQYGGENNG